MTKMQTLRRWLTLITAGLVFVQPVLLLARGGGGFGGGGGGGFRGGGGGGGGFSGGGGGFQGGANRGGNVAGHSPSFSGGSRPSAGTRPAGAGGARPAAGGGAARPGVGAGAARPGGGTGAARPGVGSGARNPVAGTGDRGNPFGGANRGQISNNANLANRGNLNAGNWNQVGNRANAGNWNRPNYNNSWHHGNWNGNWNQAHVGGWWGGYGMAGHPWARASAWGLSSWAIGSIFYDSGYGSGGESYSNPYYSTDTSGGEYNYSEPIPTNYQTASADPYEAPPEPPGVKEGTSHGDLARDAFKQNDYAKAMTEVNLALKKLPNDAALHEFRALVLFAQQDYSQAAGVLYAVLSAGPGWDWTTLSSMYSSTEIYSRQLRTLEQYVKANKNSAEGHFVLAYHYITCGHKDQAIRELKDVLQLQPKDQLSTKLLTMMGGSTTGEATPPAAQSGSGADAPPPNFPEVDAAKLVGDWSAVRDSDNSKFSLKLTSDKKFTWSYTKGDKNNKFGGSYSMDGAVLVLQRDDGGTMPGLVTLGNGGFNFKLYGGPPDDKGLEFKQ